MRLRFGSPVEKLLAAEQDGNKQGQVTQEQLNAQAQDALVDLFPKMPATDRSRIIGRAFQRGKGKVGTADNLPLARRVQLAVVAHIRHVHTVYDRLLRQVSYDEARRQVQDACLRKLMEWRGDGEDDKAGPTDLEDIMREVIVISDSEDDDEDEERISGTEDVPMADRDSSVEFISSHPVMQEVVQELMQEHPSVGLSAGWPADQDDNEQPYMVDATAEGGRRYAMQPGSIQPNIIKKGKRTKKKAGRRKGFHRYSAVDQLQQWAARAAAPSQGPTPEIPRDVPASSARGSAVMSQPYAPSIPPSQSMPFSHPRPDVHEEVRPIRFDLARGHQTSFSAGHPLQQVGELDVPPGNRIDRILRRSFESAAPWISLPRPDDAAGLAMTSGERRGSWLASPADPAPQVVRAPVMDLSGRPRYDAEERRLSTAPIASSDPWGPMNHDHRRPMAWESRPSHHERQPSLALVREDWLAVDTHSLHPARPREMNSVMPPPARARRDEPLILMPREPSRPDMSARSRTWDVPVERHVEPRRPTQPHPDGSLLVRDDLSRPSCVWVERSDPSIRRAMPAADDASRHGWERVVEVERRAGSPHSQLVLLPHHPVEHEYLARDHDIHEQSLSRAREMPMQHPPSLRASFSSLPLRESPDFLVPSLPRSADPSRSFTSRQDANPGPSTLRHSHHPSRESSAYPASDKHLPSYGRETSVIDHRGRDPTFSNRSSVRPFDGLRREWQDDDDRRRSSWDSRMHLPPDYRRMLPPTATEAHVGRPLICIPERAGRRHSPASSPRSVIVLE